MRVTIMVTLGAAMLIALGGAQRAAAAAWRPGVEVGGRLGKYVDDPELLERSFRFSWSTQGFVDRTVTERWSVVAGLGYEEVGSVLELELRDSGGQLVARSRLHQALGYLTAPVGIQWRPLRDRPLFVRVGPDVGYLERVFGDFRASGSSRFPATPARARFAAAGPASASAQIFEDPSAFFRSKDPYYPWALFLDAGVGWEFPAGGHRIVLRGRWVEGLTDVARDADGRLTLRAFEIAGGWAW